jgi:hypothetical protein
LEKESYGFAESAAHHASTYFVIGNGICFHGSAGSAWDSPVTIHFRINFGNGGGSSRSGRSKCDRNDSGLVGTHFVTPRVYTAEFGFRSREIDFAGRLPLDPFLSHFDVDSKQSSGMVRPFGNFQLQLIYN